MLSEQDTFGGGVSGRTLQALLGTSTVSRKDPDFVYKPCDLGSHPWGGSHVEPIVQSPRGVGFTETSGGGQQFLTWAQGTGLCLAPLPLSGLLLAPPLLSALSS